MRKKTLIIIQSDPYLKPYESAINGRYEYAIRREWELTGGKRLKEWASGYLYFGMHRTDRGWIFREWAPNATAVYIIGDMNGWKKTDKYRLRPVGNGVWEGEWDEKSFRNEMLYKLLVEWDGGCGQRIPAYAQRVVQDKQTRLYSAQIWEKRFVWHNRNPRKTTNYPGTEHEGLYIYECHIGMSSEEEKVSSYEEFRINILPRIEKAGYNCIQIMAIQEHPYYGSFGYHVSSFFAPSSRFGTPEELKRLIDDAHGRGLMVIMDLVHSHAIKNVEEGIGLMDGTPYQYFHKEKSRREHPAWDSLCFDYGKPQVMHFLLSNCKYWLQEFNFDGFRFDGVTSMMYLSHGLGETFTSYDDYFNGNEDGDAICYLTLANKLIHQVRSGSITIAEDMSGMPGLANAISDGGMGFDYRLAMGIPDFWIKYIKEVKDEDWKAGHIFYEMTNRRASEKTISYAESHDQALVGDKTIIFRLADSDMYWHFEHGHSTLLVDRAIALHKMIRLITAATCHGGYLNFMGNEFGHPEWIDFPREGNGWSHKYARRQWSLVDNNDYYYRNLNLFDEAMIHLLREIGNADVEKLWDNEGDQIVAFRRGNKTFIFNWSGNESYSDYGILVHEGKYKVVLNTDAVEFAGFGLSDDSLEHFTQPDPLYAKEHKGWLKMYIPARSALVLEQVN